MRLSWMFLFPIAFGTLALSADQERAPLPFEPLYAYQQKKITFNSLSQELSQFQSLNRWHSVLGEMQARRMERNSLRNAFERGEKLFAGGRITKREFNHRRYQFQKSELALAEAESDTEMARLSAEIARFGLQEDGDDQADFRREIATRMRESLRHQSESLEKRLAGARLTESLLREELQAGRELHKKGNLSLAELEERELEYREVVVRIETLQAQGQVLGQAKFGMDRSLERLYGEGH